MIILRTGLPGASKTLTTIAELCQSEYAGNVPFYYHNIKYFCLDLNAVQTFGTWLTAVYLKSKPVTESITTIISSKHQQGLLVELSDLPQLTVDYENWLSESGPQKLYIEWASIAYKGNKKLPALIDYFKQFPQCKIDDFAQFQLHWISFDDPTTWYDLPHPCQIVLDECQRSFPPRPNGSRSPRHVSEFETHRHLGTDIYLITQDAKLLDSNVRRLAGRHIHLVNLVGSKRVRRMEWPETSDPSDYHARQASIKKIITHPKHLYGCYFSALKHTHKLKIPAKLIFPFLLLPLFLYLMYTLFINIKKPLDTETAVSQPQSQYALMDTDFPLLPIETIANPVPGCEKISFAGFNYIRDKVVPLFNCYKPEIITVETSRGAEEDRSDFSYTYQANQILNHQYLALFGYELIFHEDILILSRKNALYFVAFLKNN